MQETQKKTLTCEVCHKQKRIGDVFPLEMVNDSIMKRIQNDHPDIMKTGYVCMNDLNHYRLEFVKETLQEERGELSALEEEVVRSIQEQETVSKNINAEYSQKLTFGDRVSDKLAAYGGSWRFIISFGLIILFWLILNSVLLTRKPFDPFPFILLNLILSCLAAIQAPVIMMSQNRQDAKDRLRAEYDYRVNLKAELEIHYLHQKLDHFLKKEWQTLIEIQEIQLELMNELAERKIGKS